MKNRMLNPRVQRWLRFILGGGINTAFTYTVYLAINIVLEYQLAYLLAYAIGIVFAYWFNAVAVFHIPLSWKGLFSYPVVYIIQYSVSALLLGVLVEIVEISELVGPLLVAIVMMPVTYAMSKSVLRWSSRLKSDQRSECT